MLILLLGTYTRRGINLGVTSNIPGARWKSEQFLYSNLEGLYIFKDGWKSFLISGSFLLYVMQNIGSTFWSNLWTTLLNSYHPSGIALCLYKGYMGWRLSTPLTWRLLTVYNIRTFTYILSARTNAICPWQSGVDHANVTWNTYYMPCAAN